MNAEELEKQRVALRAALDAGYRYFDTASRYGNEALIGSVLQEYYDAGKLRREDVFLTTKLPFNGHSDPDYFLERSLRELRTDYIDLYLMHTPMPTKVVRWVKYTAFIRFNISLKFFLRSFYVFEFSVKDS